MADPAVARHFADAASRYTRLRGAGLAPPRARRDCLLSSVCSTVEAGEKPR